MSKSPFSVYFLTSLLMLGCSTTPPPRALRWDEQLRQDSRVGSLLVSRLESQLSLREDVEISVYFRRIAEHLSESTAELKASPVGVFVLRDTRGSWRNYSLPGNRVYLSAGLVRQLDFENELAGVIAFELAHIVNRHVIRRLADTQGDSLGEALLASDGTRAEEASQSPLNRVELIGPAGMLTFSQEDLLKSAEVAVGILYRAGYDVRGLNALWARYRTAGNRSPYDPLTLERLADRTRQTIALFPPLRNPIVRSEEFLKIKERIRKL
jgi:predicted Zn-dependent protease